MFLVGSKYRAPHFFDKIGLDLVIRIYDFVCNDNRKRIFGTFTEDDSHWHDIAIQICVIVYRFNCSIGIWNFGALCLVVLIRSVKLSFKMPLYSDYAFEIMNGNS